MKYRTLIFVTIAALAAMILAGCGGPGPSPNPVGSRLVGKVVDGVSGDPISGVRVALGSAWVLSAADGTFTLSGISTGSGVVSFQKDGYETVTENVNIVSGTNTLPGDVNMALLAGDPPAETPRTIEGTISLVGGSKVSGAVVTLLSGETQIDQMTTSADGYYSFWAVAGTYTVRVQKTGYPVLENPVTVSDMSVVVTHDVTF